MMKSLKELCMECVLGEGKDYSLILPHQLSEETTIFFYDRLFARSVQDLVELTETVSDDPHADPADMEGLLSIIQMFAIVSRDHDIPGEDGHVQATSELIGIADLLADSLEDEPFGQFTSFLEFVIQLFIDEEHKSFSRP
jgi:hypothetical protein